MQSSAGTGLNLWTSWKLSLAGLGLVVIAGPCHPRATSSGHERYPADSHGHSRTAVALGAGQ
jgi:hypothetical protein